MTRGITQTYSRAPSGERVYTTLVRFGTALPGRRRLPGHQPRLADLIDQRTVADFQRSGGLAAIPLVGPQRLQNHVALHFLDCRLRYMLQRHGFSADQ